MKIRTLLTAVALGAVVMAGCHRLDRDAEVAKIRQLNDSIEKAEFVVNEQLANEMADMFLDFVKNFPKDTLCPVFLYKASDLYNTLGEYEKAYDCVDRIVNEYADFSEVGFCYFFRGNFLQAMNKADEAREAYQLFVDKYPDHPMAADAKIILDNHYEGLSDEEMFQKIMENASSENIAVEAME